MSKGGGGRREVDCQTTSLSLSKTLKGIREVMKMAKAKDKKKEKKKVKKAVKKK